MVNPFTFFMYAAINRNLSVVRKLIWKSLNLPAVTLIEENPVRPVIISGKYFGHGRVQAVDDVSAMILHTGDALLGHEHWKQKQIKI